MPTGRARTNQTIMRTRPGPWAAAVGLAAVGLLVAACGSTSTGAGPAASSSPSTTPSPSVSAGAVLGTVSTPLGKILVDGQGKAVYVFAADTPGHSNCTGTCLTYWPPVTAPATVPASVAGVSAQLGVIMRSDGSHQLTVGGWPVYTYSGDNGPGMTSGQGKNLSGGLWWVVSPTGTQIKSSAAASSAPASPKPSTSKSSGGGGWA